MPRETAPREITLLADARARARRARDWATADDLKAQIEAAGWKVVDTGTLYDLHRAVPPDVEVDGVTHYGAAASVPSRLAEPATGTVSVVLVATDDAAALVRSHAAIAASAPSVSQVVVVANAPAEDVASAVEAVRAATGGPAVEVIHTARRLGHAEALNAGLRRCTSPVVMLLDPSVELRGDLPGACASALADPAVAVAGPVGLVSEDLRSFEPADDGAGECDVDVIDGAAMAFRREDVEARGPLDDHFVIPAHLDTWWSLVLRDPWAVEEPVEGAPVRRAVRLVGIPVVRHPSVAPAGARGGEEKLAKKAFYRVLKRFATRHDLLVARQP